MKSTPKSHARRRFGANDQRSHSLHEPKKSAIAPVWRCAHVQGSTAALRSAAWLGRLRAAQTEPFSAETLYAGDHWQVVRSLPNIAAYKGIRLEVWVCSAGYGLIPITAKIRPYAATFASNHPDSVELGLIETFPRMARRTWWKHLANWEGPEPGSPRHIADLARKHPNSIMLVAASTPYLDALIDDLEETSRVLDDPLRLAIFSAGGRVHPTLDEQRIPCDARLQALLGGALGSLNVRCLKHAIQSVSPNLLRAPVLQDAFCAALKSPTACAAVGENSAFGRRSPIIHPICHF